MLVSDSVLHRYISPLAPHYAVSQLQSAFFLAVITYSPLYASDCPLVEIRLSKCCWLLVLYTLIARLEPFTLFKTALDNPTMFCPFLVWEGCSSHDITGLAGRCTTRRCCSQLQYCNSIFKNFEIFCMFWTSWFHPQDGSKHVEDVKNLKIELKC